MAETARNSEVCDLERDGNRPRQGPVQAEVAAVPDCDASTSGTPRSQDVDNQDKDASPAIAEEQVNVADIPEDPNEIEEMPNEEQDQQPPQAGYPALVLILPLLCILRDLLSYSVETARQTCELLRSELTRALEEARSAVAFTEELTIETLRAGFYFLRNPRQAVRDVFITINQFLQSINIEEVEKEEQRHKILDVMDDVLHVMIPEIPGVPTRNKSREESVTRRYFYIHANACRRMWINIRDAKIEGNSKCKAVVARVVQSSQRKAEVYFVRSARFLLETLTELVPS